MKPIYHRGFKKQYKHLPPSQKKRFAQALALFVTDPYHRDLYNHPLTGKWKGHRSISFGGDWRAHYTVINERTVMFVAVGSHSQLYK